MKSIATKLVTIKILDQTGDTTLEQRIEEAVATIAKQHFAHSKMPYVNAEEGAVPFEFTATSINDAEGLLKDTIRLRKLLEDYDQPLIVMTGPLQGGTR